MILYSGKLSKHKSYHMKTNFKNKKMQVRSCKKISSIYKIVFTGTLCIYMFLYNLRTNKQTLSMLLNDHHNRSGSEASAIIISISQSLYVYVVLRKCVFICVCISIRNHIISYDILKQKRVLPECFPIKQLSIHH